MAANSRFATSRLTSTFMILLLLLDLKFGSGRTLAFMTTTAKDVFNESYQAGAPPWVIGEPQPAIVALEQTGMIAAGCWTRAAALASTPSC